ncbi:hypothetical protein HX109_15450 [Galbibacter sp. BG1]|uniref:hypothetical protein n=1 Tax=Galbibacter sp. BG1 TaxID=1170699 RepID=UPI0015BB04A8|nr:hypothetical protein [Galbibacter sp. BG1]QLE02895.1 hypothetical protein HX109_15450 [Galbibacter sp. BG1]
MRLVYLFITVVLTFGIAFLTSLALDAHWVISNMVRELLVVIIIILELCVGFLVAKELLK